MYYHIVIIIPIFLLFSPMLIASPRVISYRAENHQDLATLQGWCFFFALGAWWFTLIYTSHKSQSVRFDFPMKSTTQGVKTAMPCRRSPGNSPRTWSQGPMIPPWEWCWNPHEMLPCLMLTIPHLPSFHRSLGQLRCHSQAAQGAMDVAVRRATDRLDLEPSRAPRCRGILTRQGSWFVKGTNMVMYFWYMKWPIISN